MIIYYLIKGKRPTHLRQKLHLEQLTWQLKQLWSLLYLLYWHSDHIKIMVKAGQSQKEAVKMESNVGVAFEEQAEGMPS